MRIKQGDAYNIYINLRAEDGSIIDVGDEAELVEITLGNLRKTCPGEIIQTRVAPKWRGNARDVFKTRLGPEEDPAYVNVECIEVTGMFGYYHAGDFIDVKLEPAEGEPLLAPITEAYEIPVIGTYYDEDNDKEYLVLDNYNYFGRSNFAAIFTIQVSHSGDLVMPLTQQETFALSGVAPLESRVKFMDGSVVGTSLGVVNVEESQSREVL